MPVLVSAIIAKLLSKQSEERYQSAKALQFDIEQCLAQLRSSGLIGDFKLGSRDAPAGFRISQKLYGREHELTGLLAALNRAAHGSVELVLISGAPGIGKSCLVRNIEGDARHQGAFVMGKFEQYKQNEPYSVIVQAFKDLIEYLMGGDDESIRDWRDLLVKALDVNGGVIAAFVPEIELIVGPQPNVQELPAAEKLNRLNMVFRKFVRVFAREGHRLCLFFDDLQWADAASLTLLKALLADPDMAYLVVIGAYRTAERADADTLSRSLSEAYTSRVNFSNMKLLPLQVQHVSQLLRDTLHCGDDEAVLLADLVCRKTDGNPFVLNQFLVFLHRDRLIELDDQEYRWRWDLRRIAAQGITEGVLALTTGKLVTLPTLTQEALKAAACLSSRFRLSELSLVMQKSEQETLSALRPAEQEGLIIATFDTGEVRNGGGGGAGESIDPTGFQFLHDRLQQAAYALIDPTARQEMRLRIGRALYAHLSGESRKVIPFNVLDNLNEGAVLLSDPAERDKIAALNLVVGRRARELAAYDAALEYFRNGMKLLRRQSWHEQYVLTLDLHLERLECAYVTGYPQEANSLFGEVLNNAQTPVDKAKAYYLKILINSGLDRSDEAVALGIEALRLFRQTLPVAPRRIRLLAELMHVVLLLRGRRASHLLALPSMRDAERISVMNLLMSICPAAYFRNPDLMALAALRIVKSSLRYGNASASSFGYVLYGLVRGALLGDYKGGHEFGHLAVELAEHHGTLIQRCKIVMIFAGFIAFWREPIDASVNLLRNSLKQALDSGDVQYANYSILQILFLRLARGADLGEVYSECIQHERFIWQTKDWFAISSHGIRKQNVLALRGETQGGWKLTDAKYDEESALTEFRSVGNMTVLSYYHIVKMQLAYLFGRLKDAHFHSEISQAQIKSVINQIVVAEHHFYSALTAAALMRQDGRSKSLWGTFRRCRATLQRMARNCPDNFAPHHFLVEAEFASLSSRFEEAERLLHEAIDAAQKCGFLHLEALANELVGEQYLKRNRPQIAKSYLAAAQRTYAKWGATAKVRQILENNASLFEGEPQAAKAQPAEQAVAPRDQVDVLDLDTLARATTVMSAEIESDRLLSKLMRLMLESAGGERVLLLAQREDGLRVEAAASSDGAQVRLLEPSVNSEALFSNRVVQYVLRTGSRLIIEDARSDTRFSSCPYIAAVQPRSIVCLPLLEKNELIGAAYIENRLASGTCAETRLPSLTVLSQQVAAVIENSRLHHILSDNISSLKSAIHNVDLLEHIRGHLTKFVPQAVTKLIETNPHDPDLSARNEDISIVFLDIAGYTSMSERLDPQELKTLVERYFSNFLDDIHRNQGDINGVAGDGLMLIFRHANINEHAKLAVRTALAICKKTALLTAEGRGRWPAVIINVGIHSGEALVGANKIESGIGTRWIYTATGYVANLAARIGASATNGAILVSDATAARLGGEFELQGTGPQMFKGISRPIDVYRVISAR